MNMFGLLDIMTQQQGPSHTPVLVEQIFCSQLVGHLHLLQQFIQEVI